jgi:Uma2 family endonuclease
MVDGEEFVSPSPRWIHQLLVQQFAFLLSSFLKGKRLGMLVAPVDLHYDKENYVSPDLSFFTTEQGRLLRDAEFSELPPPLVVEVLSKSSIKWDREDKRGFYRRFGVLEYWIIDPFKQTIEVIDLRTDTSSMGDPAVSRVLEGFSVSWQDLFAPEG